MLQKYPNMTPDQVKAFIKKWGVQPTTAPEWRAQSAGAGEIDLATMAANKPPKSYVQTWPEATGTGTLEGSRGTEHLTDDGVVLEGEIDIFGHAVRLDRHGHRRGGRELLVGRHLERQRLDRRLLERQQLVGRHLDRRLLERQQLVRQQLERQQLVGQQLERQQLVGNSWSGNSWSGNSWSGASWSGDKQSFGSGSEGSWS